MAPSLSTMRKEDLMAILSSNTIMMNALLERRRRLRKIIMQYLKENPSTPRTWILPRPSEFYEHAVLSMSDKQFKEEFRVNRVTFRYLVREMKEMERVDTHWRKCIPIEKRICIALYTLASSCEYRTVRNLFGVGKSTVCVILHQFCSLMVEKLKSKFVEMPTTREKILTCVEDFEMLWDFPQCMGSIDGTYIKIQPPKDDAHSYFCHKSFYSTVLLAVCDANYRFTYINVGSAGRCNDAFILRNSSLFKFLGSNVLRELSKPLGGVDVPVCLIGDAAFPLMPTLQKPYPDSKLTSSTAKHYNYRLSRAPTNARVRHTLS